MIEIKFSNEQIEKLHWLQKQPPHPVARRRSLALILKSQNVPHHKIATIVDVSENTIRKYFDMYQQGGIKELTMVNFRKSSSQLEPFETVIREYFEKTPPHTMRHSIYRYQKIDWSVS